MQARPASDPGATGANNAPGRYSRYHFGFTF